MTPDPEPRNDEQPPIEWTIYHMARGAAIGGTAGIPFWQREQIADLVVGTIALNPDMVVQWATKILDQRMSPGIYRPPGEPPHRHPYERPPAQVAPPVPSAVAEPAATTPDLTWVERTRTLDAVDRDAIRATEDNPGWRLIAIGVGPGSATCPPGQTTLTYGWPWPESGVGSADRAERMGRVFNDDDPRNVPDGSMSRHAASGPADNS